MKLAMMAMGLTISAATFANAALFNPETFQLSNGMEVVVIPNHRSPVVSHWVWYKVGTADSPPGKSGLPHFVEHLMFKGTESIEPGEFSKIIARNGGKDNAMTSHDFTAYFQNIAKDRLEMVMEMEADRMTGLILTDEEVLPERDVVIEERRSRVENDPGSLLAEQLNAVFYMHHPYRLPVIGWMHEMETYSLKDAVDFYETWYAPNNAILIVAGDITAAELRPLAERIYGSIPARDVPERIRLKEPPQISERRIVLEDEKVRQPVISRAYHAPSYTQADGNEAYALEVLADYFGTGSTSRLYQNMVVNSQKAVSAGSYYRGSSYDGSSFRLYASPRPGVELADLEEALDQEIALFLEEGFTEQELEKVKSRMVAESVYARDSLGAAARSFGVALTTGSSVDEVEAWPERIAAVSVEDVMKAAAKVFDKNQSVTGWLVQTEDQIIQQTEG